MDKQKQIEEMAKATGGCDYPHRPCEKCWCKEKDECGAYAYAKTLIEKGYRKIPENAVVLTREEYQQHKGFSREEVDEISETAIKNSRKETAEKFAERLKAQYPPRTDKRCTLDDCYMLDKIDEICKEITGEKV